MNTRWSSRWITILLTAFVAGGAGCHVYLWAGDHEVVLPPPAEPTPAAAPVPDYLDRAQSAGRPRSRT